MGVIRLIFWVAVGALLAWFATTNWTPVTLAIGGGWEVATRLPVLLLIAFFLGLVPPLVVLSASRIAERRRLAKAEARAASLERELADRVLTSPREPVTAPEPLPVQAHPLPVPPAGA